MITTFLLFEINYIYSFKQKLTQNAIMLKKKKKKKKKKDRV